METVIKFLLLLALIAPVLLNDGIRARILSLPRASLLCSLLLFLSVIAGHAVRKPFWTYPFITWDMYSRTTSTVPMYSLVTAELQSGRQIHFPFDSISCVSTRNILNNVLKLAQAASRATELGDTNRVEKISADFQRLAELANVHSRTDPIVRLNFIRCDFDFRDLDKNRPARTNFLFSHNVER